MTDPREQPLNDVARKIMVTSNYDPHFSAIEERIIMETKLFLARLDALDGHYAQRESARLEHRSVPRIPDPIPMILFCPNCGMQHIDAPEPHKLECNVMPPLAPGGLRSASTICDCGRWTNPPHRSHLCADCSKVWRPADVPTTGVAEIATRGSRDGSAIRNRASHINGPDIRDIASDVIAARHCCMVIDFNAGTDQAADPMIAGLPMVDRSASENLVRLDDAITALRKALGIGE